MNDLHRYEKEFAILLRTRREFLGKTQTVFSLCIGVNNTTIALWESPNDTHLPSLSRLAKIAEIYQIEFDTLKNIVEKAREQRKKYKQLRVTLKDTHKPTHPKRQLVERATPVVFRG